MEQIQILYIDDNPMDRALVRDSLEKEHGGFILKEAGSKQEFEKLIRNDTFDLVLTDFNILGFEGLQVLETVNSLSPGTPVIIVTGTGSEEIAVEAMKRGASDYVIKSHAHIQRLPKSIFIVLEKVKAEAKQHDLEKALRKSEAKYFDLYENAPEMYLSLDVDTASIVNCNKTVVEKLNYSREELLGKKIFELYHPDCLEAAKKTLALFRETGAVKNIELQVTKKDGTIIDIMLNSSAIRDENGKIVLSRSIWLDITELKRLTGSLEKKIEELEWLNQMMINREIKMIDLKKEINALLAELGRGEKYVIHNEI